MPFPTTNPSLERALADRGYNDPTPVQAAVLEPDARDRDLLVSAQTGSGKTVAYGLAMASTLLGDAERFDAPREPLALIIAPTRELALQVNRELIWLYGPAGARVASCVGGMDVRREQRALADGCHIVVGTPGRLRDHLERGRLDTSKMRVVVLDEADEMLDLGFREDLEFILDATPEDRRTLLFSATLPKNIITLARRYQRDAHRIDTLVENEPHGDIEYRALRIAPNEVEHAVVNVLRFYESRGAMVFCHTREAVRHLHASLIERGFAAVAISGELTQNERSNALQSLRDGRARVCVATDVAARGIDLPDLGLVIHFDLPNDHETLLHRSGRTGRAGRKGVCVMLVPYTRRRKAERLIDMAGVDVTWAGPPSADEIRQRDRERMMQDPIFSEEVTDDDLAMARALLAERSAEDIANALARFFRARLPAPEEIVDAGADREPRQRKDKRERQDERQRGFKERGRGASDEGFERSSEDMVWFRMSVGRRNNADPRWLLPIICRLGHVTKKEIGSIKIFDRETKFEIAKSHAPKFASAVRKSNDEDIRIEPADAGPGKAPDRRPREGKPWDKPKGKGSQERSGPPPFRAAKDGKGPKDHKRPKDRKRSFDKRP
ncbi:DEAD/DEAH box helicase [Microvirga lotononidis]|uniref:DNA/RNA helicase, superfamily II n=1 Tax=Microvirga lotononidis TaxID=864069 RepID=I4YVC6_9HYPH|nr:DEAD/DEAH box helicase [Microvirga lotononidis]EIM27918.1 DNA/RNA helicase, superfamily II [Microvirga lotononidis]WQO27957.1 DEAD/DEAH box helicase [Microvirga lotononidis]